ncbi:hypothetical protein ACPPVS_11575 [Cellulomonas sp. McL0617]|uniref:hypothetical protein n=1 Tax=Cellulomonas sp. McL0617 TaxID=3415675 RepID=UPI003CF1C1EA
MIVRVGLDEGGLTGRIAAAAFPDGDFRNRYFRGDQGPHVERRNGATSDGRRLTEERRAVIRRHRWERNVYRARDDAPPRPC